MMKDIKEFLADDSKNRDIIAVNEFVIKFVDKISHSKEFTGKSIFTRWPNNYRLPPSQSVESSSVSTPESPKR